MPRVVTVSVAVDQAVELDRTTSAGKATRERSREPDTLWFGGRFRFAD